MSDSIIDIVNVLCMLMLIVDVTIGVGYFIYRLMGNPVGNPG